jgi:hypothetical protein
MLNILPKQVKKIHRTIFPVSINICLSAAKTPAFFCLPVWFGVEKEAPFPEPLFLSYA